MNAPAVILRPKHRPSSILERMRLDALSDRTMDAIGALTASALSHGHRVHLAKQVIRYGAVCLCHALGLRLTSAFLASIQGQIDRGIDEEAGNLLRKGGSRR